jgi:hypothetical protein
MGVSELSASRPVRFTFGEIPGTYGIGGWAGRKAGLDAVANLLSAIDPRSLSLYLSQCTS